MDYFCVVMGTAQCDIPLEPVIHLICTQMTNLMGDMHKITHFSVVPWHQYYSSGRPPGIQRLFMQSVHNCLTWYMMNSDPLKVILDAFCCHKVDSESISHQIVILMTSIHLLMACSRHTAIRVNVLVTIYQSVDDTTWHTKPSSHFHLWHPIINQLLYGSLCCVQMSTNITNSYYLAK